MKFKLIILVSMICSMFCCAKPIYISLEIIEADCTYHTNVFNQYSVKSQNLSPSELVSLSYDLEGESTIKFLILEHFQKLNPESNTAFSTWHNKTKLQLSLITNSADISVVGKIDYAEDEYYRKNEIHFKTKAPLRVDDSEILYWESESFEEKKLIRFIRLHTSYSVSSRMKYDLTVK